jgi:aryl-alcohol dehydrogenase-like predicted oxidoreductase
MSPTRREFIQYAVTGAVVMRWPQRALISKPIPSSGERIPVIGLGSAGTFSLSPNHPEYPEGQAVIKLFHELGGRVIDTAPSYGLAERFVDRAAAQDPERALSRDQGQRR